jgi:hypothetical protein
MTLNSVSLRTPTFAGLKGSVPVTSIQANTISRTPQSFIVHATDAVSSAMLFMVKKECAEGEFPLKKKKETTR